MHLRAFQYANRAHAWQGNSALNRRPPICCHILYELGSLVQIFLWKALILSTRRYVSTPNAKKENVDEHQEWETCCTIRIQGVYLWHHTCGNVNPALRCVLDLTNGVVREHPQGKEGMITHTRYYNCCLSDTKKMQARGSVPQAQRLYKIHLFA